MAFTPCNDSRHVVRRNTFTLHTHFSILRDMTDANTTLTWWNLIPQHLDPVLVHIGSFPVHWYGLMYLAAFFTCYHVIWKTITRDGLKITKEQLDDITAWIIAGVLIGARLGYVLFYNLPYYLGHPTEAILPCSTEGGVHFTGISGMSYHGGLIGALV